MSTNDHDDNEAVAQLKRDVASYLRGQAPLSADLAAAPLLENWRTAIFPFGSIGHPRQMALVLTGRVTGHPHLVDDRTIRTSQLIWLDRSGKWARSWNRVYRLGKPARHGANPGEDEV